MKLLHAILLAFASAPVLAQITFQRVYGGEGADQGNSVAQTTDSGYVVSGWTESSGAGRQDLWLLKTDKHGVALWTRTYGGADYDRGYSVIETMDHGYVVAGWTRSFGSGEYDAWLLKTDKRGDTVWARTFGGFDWERASSLAETADSGYVFAGYTASFGSGHEDAWLVKTDRHGDTVWTRTYGGEGWEDARSVARTSDSGFILAGRTDSYGAGEYDAWLIRTDAQGDTLWTRTYGGTGWDELWSSVQTADGGFMAVGQTRDSGALRFDAWLIRTDAQGDTLWTRTYGDTGSENLCSVAETADGGLVAAGRTGSYGLGRDDAWLIRTSSGGDTVWIRTFGGPEPDEASSLVLTNDGGYAITGWTMSFGEGIDAWLVKTDSAGYVAIAERNPASTHRPSPAATITLSRLLSALQQDPAISLFDASGRRLLNPRPGVCFIRQRAESGAQRTVSKVLIAD